MQVRTIEEEKTPIVEEIPITWIKKELESPARELRQKCEECIMRNVGFSAA